MTGPRAVAAILGRFFAELAYDELAAATNESPDALRVRIVRAMPELRACLESKGVTS